jgi:hypothetical protein
VSLRIGEEVAALKDSIESNVSSITSQMEANSAQASEQAEEQMLECSERFEVVAANLHTALSEGMASTAIRIDTVVSEINGNVADEVSGVYQSIDSANRAFVARLAQETKDFRAHLDAVPASLLDLEVRLDTKCTDALQAQHDDILSELQRESDEFVVKWFW